MIDRLQHRDLAPERQSRVMAIVRRGGAVRVDQLSAELEVSAATVRRDLEALERQGQVKRVHGGAVRMHARLDEPLFDDKEATARPEKVAIARAALALIGNGETVYLDGGSTVLELARLLVARESVTIVTNSLRAAAELAAGGPKLIVIGGELRRRSQTIVGTLTRQTLETIHLDKAFMGTMGLTLDGGLSTTDPNEAFTKELVMARSEQVVLLAHHAKFGSVAFSKSGNLDDLDLLITDDGADAAFVKSLRRVGVSVMTVGRDGKAA
jgi:DeoR family transcriptional regulator, fructose operon transcriptional repressor